MVYKQKILGLLESLEGKIHIIENVSRGSMNMDAQQVNQVIEQIKNTREQIYDLVNFERD